MGERKVQNKYYPPDFDPAKIPRRSHPKNKQMTVRMMLPMSVRCNTCGEYISKGTKSNCRKEDAVGETYLGIQIFRFYFDCTGCCAEISYKTDPQNSDYVVESGATRNFEPWREQKKKRQTEEMGDAMQSLENTTLNSKRYMDIVAALDELKSMKSRRSNVSVDTMLEALQCAREKEKKKKLEQEEDEAHIKSVFKKARDAVIVRRIQDDDDDDYDDRCSKRMKVLQQCSNPKPRDVSTIANANGGTLIFNSSSVKVSVIKKKAAQSNGQKTSK